MQTDFSLERSEPDDQHDSEANPPSSLALADAINTRCPRSGKPIVASSLAIYRGYTVGFCNQHCRDDFAANIEQRPNDRKFFDDAISKQGRD